MSATRLLVLALLLAIVAIAGIAVGGAAFPPQRVLQAVAHPRAGDDVTTIVWTLRFPRVATAAVVGASLALAGTFMQALLRNPLVDPYLTGISSGAAASIAVAVALGVAPSVLTPLGFISGLATAVLVAVLARSGSGLDRERLILCGVAISALLAAVVTVALLVVAHDFNAATLLAWLAGSLAGRGWPELFAAAPAAMLGAGAAAFALPALNVMRVGEARAATLGVDVVRLQWLLLCASTLLTSAAVALAGLVGFVGLLVPHVARRIVGEDLRVVVPAAALLGAALVVLADAAARTLVAPAEIPLGVLLAFVGVPTFFVLYLRGAAGSYA